MVSILSTMCLRQKAMTKAQSGSPRSSGETDRIAATPSIQSRRHPNHPFKNLQMQICFNTSSNWTCEMVKATRTRLQLLNHQRSQQSLLGTLSRRTKVTCSEAKAHHNSFLQAMSTLEAVLTSTRPQSHLLSQLLICPMRSNTNLTRGVMAWRKRLRSS